MVTVACKKLREIIGKVEKVGIVELRIGPYRGQMFEKSENSKSFPLREKKSLGDIRK